MIKNKIRTLSGVTPVALLTKPYPCPGKCIYCPIQEGIPKSYLSNEPAVMRAVANNFEPVRQIWQRLKMYETAGHSIDKIEIIIIGGTWSYYPKDYQEWFIKSIYWALNNYGSTLRVGPSIGSNPSLNTYLPSLEVIKKENETAKCRCVGMSVETRPDYINIEEIERLRNYGVTRVELGVQTVDDRILKLIKRGHGRKEIINATSLLKDAGFKVCYHLMPNLPGSTPEKDYEVFREIFTNPDFCPDQLKIYPCVLAGESELKKWYQKGRWKPYDNETLINLLVKVKSELIPRYVRIMRLYRDIPASEIEAGSKSSHLRQIIRSKLLASGKKCSCIRCREIMDQPQEKKLTLRRTDYFSSGGKEIFLEFVDSQDRIYGLLRLRIPHFPTLSVLKKAGIVRELHIFGKSLCLTPLCLTPGVELRLSHLTPGVERVASAQHKGLGKKLLAVAEKIVKKEFNLPKIAVISGVGVREYYRDLGYRLRNEYMVKTL